MKKIILLLVLIIFCGKINAQKDKIQNPVQNFEKLWSEFDLRYANFDLKKIDWEKKYQKYSPLINEFTTNEKLFEICCMMLQELNDGHVTIEADFEEMEMDCGPPYESHYDLEFETAIVFQGFEMAMNTELNKNGFSEAIRCEVTKETNFQYRTSNTLGYLRIDEMTEKITSKFKKALDSAVNAFQEKDGIIIDLRFNGGGWDYMTYKLSSRFIEEAVTLGHYERTRIKGKNEFTKMKFKNVASRGKFQFTKPIVILTSDFTASAAEVFILLMKDLPYVTIIGDNTEGIFSDMFEFKLPNKWLVSLSNQQFFSRDKINYEGKGIEPKIRVLNSKSDIENQSDPVIEMAVEYLEKK